MLTAYFKAQIWPFSEYRLKTKTCFSQFIFGTFCKNRIKFYKEVFPNELNESLFWTKIIFFVQLKNLHGDKKNKKKTDLYCQKSES